MRPDGTAILRDRRATHVMEVHRAVAGDSLRVGVVGGLLGEGTVLRIEPGLLELKLHLQDRPPPPLGIDLLLALPRPKVLKKVIPAAASLGVKRIVLVNAARVEKSYFASPVLDGQALRSLLLLGLEQARDTILPDLCIRQRFRPFVEDEVAGLWSAPTVRLLAHPNGPSINTQHARVQGQRIVVAIGPEGGWVPFEVELLEKHGFEPFSVGPRILRVDTAVAAIVSQLALLAGLA